MRGGAVGGEATLGAGQAGQRGGLQSGEAS